MAATHSQQSRKHLTSWLIAGLAGLAALLVWLKIRNEPTRVIAREFRKAGIPDGDIKLWTAIAKHETAGFTSRVYKDAKNLFGMTKPSQGAYEKGWTTATQNVLPYGERQVIFKSIADSARDQTLFITKRFSYPKNFASLLELVTYMKQRGYFTDSLDNYYNAAKKWL